MAMWDEFQAFFKTSWIRLAIAILLLVAGWRMTTPIANWLLVIAWAILVGTFYRTPFIANQPPVPMALFMAVFGGAIGLTIWFTLWTKIEDAPLYLGATTSAAVKPAGTTLGGIHWLSSYGDLRFEIYNGTDFDYQGLDLAIVPDVAVTAAGQLTNVQGISLSFNNNPSTTMENFNPSSGERLAMPYHIIASEWGYRLRCERLSSHSSIELIMAVVSMNEVKPALEVDNVIRANFSDGHSVWSAHRDHTEKIFGNKPVPSLVKVTGRYIAQQIEHKVSESIVVKDIMAEARQEAIKEIMKPSESPEAK